MNATTATTRRTSSNRQESYLRVFDTKNAARDRMELKNRANRMPRWTWAIVEHPEGWAVVDIRTAIEMGLGYEWSV